MTTALTVTTVCVCFINSLLMRTPPRTPGVRSLSSIVASRNFTEACSSSFAEHQNIARQLSHRTAWARGPRTTSGFRGFARSSQTGTRSRRKHPRFGPRDGGRVRNSCLTSPASDTSCGAALLFRCRCCSGRSSRLCCSVRRRRFTAPSPRRRSVLKMFEPKTSAAPRERDENEPGSES